VKADTQYLQGTLEARHEAFTQPHTDKPKNKKPHCLPQNFQERSELWAIE
jgi:hypothetical protein